MRLVAMSLVFGFVIHAGTKTNSPPLGMMMPILPSLPQSVVQQITDQEIAQGWRLESVTTNDAVSYAMPEGVSPTFNWHKRGTFGEWSRLDLGDFAFPIGTNGETVTSFSVFSDGRIRPRPRDVGREICAVGVPMLAMQGASRFWVAEEAACTRDARPYRYVAFVPPHGCVSFSIEYEAETHSDSAGDIFVSAVIFPNDRESVSDSASATAVKVLLEARYGAPVNGNKLRHRYGVREEVFCKHLPEALPVSWSSCHGDFKDTGNAVAVFTAPICGGECALAISANYETYMMKCSILEPEKFYCERVSNVNEYPKLIWGLARTWPAGLA